MVRNLALSLPSACPQPALRLPSAYLHCALGTSAPPRSRAACPARVFLPRSAASLEAELQLRVRKSGFFNCQYWMAIKQMALAVAQGAKGKGDGSPATPPPLTDAPKSSGDCPALINEACCSLPSVQLTIGSHCEADCIGDVFGCASDPTRHQR